MNRATSPLLRAAPYMALAALGFAVAMSARTSAPANRPRLERGGDIVGLIQREDARVRDLRTRLEDLQADYDELIARSSGTEGAVGELRRRIDLLAPAAGLTAVIGPGLAVELKDSTLRESPTGDPNDLVVHEEDLQAVVNGLWAAGAEAISVNGERITAFSAIRCVGNTLLLHGSVYSPPYRIHAIGEPAEMEATFVADPLVERVRLVADKFELGFSVSRQERLELPGYRGAVIARHARET